MDAKVMKMHERIMDNVLMKLNDETTVVHFHRSGSPPSYEYRAQLELDSGDVSVIYYYTTGDLYVDGIAMQFLDGVGSGVASKVIEFIQRSFEAKVDSARAKIDIGVAEKLLAKFES